MRLGWQCPVCERVWAPFVEECGPCNEQDKFDFTTTRPAPEFVPWSPWRPVAFPSTTSDTFTLKTFELPSWKPKIVSVGREFDG